MCSAFLLAPLTNGECQTIQETMKKGAKEFKMDLCLKCYDLSLNIYYAVQDGLIRRSDMIHGETWFHVMRIENTIFIVFRGTAFDKRDNVMTDVDVWRVYLDAEIFPQGRFKGEENYGVKVHRGFQGAYLEAHDALHKKLDEIRTGDENIVLCGHSMGAAIAQLCALDLVLANPECKIEMYLFASPRLGNSRFVMLMKNKIPKSFYRVIMEGDPAANYPQVGGYVHAGMEVWLNKKGEMDFNMGHMRKWVMPYAFNFYNHSMLTYGDALSTACRVLLRKNEKHAQSTDDDWLSDPQEPYMSSWPVEIQGWVRNLRGVLT